MRRFLPYLLYLRGRRLALVVALLCGAVSGLVYGYGLPKVMSAVFPKIFTNAAGEEDTLPLPRGKSGVLLSPLSPQAAPAGALTSAQEEANTESIKARRTLPRRQIVLYALLVPMIFLVRAVCGFLNNYLMSHCGIGVLEALRVELYRKLQHLPLSYFGRNRTGDLLSRLTVDTQVVQQVITGSASDLVIQPLTLIGAIYFLTRTALENHGVGLFLASLAAVPACVFPVRFIGKKLLRRAGENQQLLGDISDLASQNMAAAREVRAFGLEEKEISLFQ